MFLMPHPYVTSATIKDSKIAVSVLVDDFQDYEYIEISGHATQADGAFANIYEIAPIPATASADGHLYVEVTAVPLPPNRFRKNQDVEIVLRASKVWLTVLGRQEQQQSEEQQQQQQQSEEQQQQQQQQQPASTAYEGMIWDVVKKVSDISGDSGFRQGGN
jgi:septum formation inhibitor MinC